MTAAAVETVIACAHGTADPAGQRQIRALRGRITEILDGRSGESPPVQDSRGSAPNLRVLEASVDVQDPALVDVMAALDSSLSAVILPLLLSTGFHTRVDLKNAAAGHASATIAAPLGPDPRLAEALALRLSQAGLCTGGDLPLDAVVLAAAGSSVAQGAEDVRAVADELRRIIPNPVVVGFGASAQPSIAEAVRQARLLAAPGGRVVAASYILASGYFHGVVERSGADAVAPALLDCGPAAWDGAAEFVAQCAITRLDEARGVSQ